MPDGPALELGLTPRLESWERREHPAQVALREFVAHVHELVDPQIESTQGELAFRLEVGLARDVDPLWERDLDNYLLPIARTLPERVVSVWGTKGRAERLCVRLERAVEIAEPDDWHKCEVPRARVSLHPSDRETPPIAQQNRNPPVALRMTASNPIAVRRLLSRARRDPKEPAAPPRSNAPARTSHDVDALAAAQRDRCRTNPTTRHTLEGDSRRGAPERSVRGDRRLPHSRTTGHVTSRVRSRANCCFGSAADGRRGRSSVAAWATKRTASI
jgi:hypothetical protein